MTKAIPKNLSPISQLTVSYKLVTNSFVIHTFILLKTKTKIVGFSYDLMAVMAKKTHIKEQLDQPQTSKFT